MKNQWIMELAVIMIAGLRSLAYGMASAHSTALVNFGGIHVYATNDPEHKTDLYSNIKWIIFGSGAGQMRAEDDDESKEANLPYGDASGGVSVSHANAVVEAYRDNDYVWHAYEGTFAKADFTNHTAHATATAKVLHTEFYWDGERDSTFEILVPYSFLQFIFYDPGESASTYSSVSVTLSNWRNDVTITKSDSMHNYTNGTDAYRNDYLRFETTLTNDNQGVCYRFEGTVTNYAHASSPPAPVPVPGALVLSSLGVGLVNWLRRQQIF